MSVVVDTTVWSLVLRREARTPDREQRRLRLHLADLIRDGRVVLLGSIRQEVLSGFSDLARFEQLRDYLREFDDEPTITWDYERAAEHYNVCRAHGIQGSAVDLLICAVAERIGAEIFTTDEDFDIYAQHVPVRIYRPPSS
jgi:predicted nucleic acid-binding protein